MSNVTRVIQKGDLSEALLVQQLHLRVLNGPNRGLELLLDRPRVSIGTGEECDLQLDDSSISRVHAELQATTEGHILRDLHSTNGTVVGGVQVRWALIVRSAELLLGKTRIAVTPSNSTVELPLSSKRVFGRLLGQSPAMRHAFAQLERVAGTDATVLLTGESGTGKELAAEAVHEASARREAPYIVVDCGAIAGNLIESELFGHERGAFSGADHQRVGALEQADRGTVFLDEVGELPPELQPRLLRFIESQQIKPVGANRHRQVNVRIVAATNRSLTQDVESGAFRADLFYRLSVVNIELPPLRERGDDVLLLAYHFAEALVRDPEAVMTAELKTMLNDHDWPGNVRELRNVVERLAMFPDIDPLADSSQAPKLTSPSGIGELAELPFHQGRAQWQQLFDREYLSTQLERAKGVVAQAARNADLPRQTFHKLLRRYGLK